MSKTYLVTIYEEKEIIFDKIRVPEDFSIEQFDKLMEDPTVKIKEIEEDND